MNLAGRLEINVGGERWTPVTTLARCGPQDPCYVIRIDDEGAATLVFGDGTTGRRPPMGARVEAMYGPGSGETGNVATGRLSDPFVALLQLWGQIGDLLSQYQEQIASEAYLETDGDRISLADSVELRQSIARHREARVCICFRPMSRRADQIKQ
jgi:hypothetical protein